MEQHTKSPTLKGYYDGCPIGTVLAYAGPWTETLKDLGWQLCNGDSLDPDKYPDLHTAIGDIYGKDGNNFKLPDHQGYFIRGVNITAKGKDPNRAVGSSQDDDFKKHKHQWRGYHHTTASAVGNHSRAEEYIGGDDLNDCTLEVGGDETRPVNIAMNYIIKVKNIM